MKDMHKCDFGNCAILDRYIVSLVLDHWIQVLIEYCYEINFIITVFLIWIFFKIYKLSMDKCLF